MLTAMKNDGDTHHMARDVQRKDGPFYCPVCGEEVIIHKGRVRIHHFAHKANSTCEYGTNESEAHLQCKTTIFDALSAYDFLECSMEEPLAGVRPDILIKSKRRNLTYAVEVQISNLTMDKIIHRTQRYAKLGIFVLWLPLFTTALVDEKTIYIEGVEIAEKRYSPKQWEKWLHALNFGSVYYWVDGLQIAKVHFDDYLLWVDSFETFGGDSVGGYEKVSRRWKTPVVVSDNLSILSSFRPALRSSWSGGNIQIPRCRILLDGEK